LSAQQLQQNKEETVKKVIEPKVVEMKDAVGYLEQIKIDEPPQSYTKFLEIMTEFRSEK
jgi:histone deacetylase complex regulatory component SIN3